MGLGGTKKIYSRRFTVRPEPTPRFPWLFNWHSLKLSQKPLRRVSLGLMTLLLLGNGIVGRAQEMPQQKPSLVAQSPPEIEPFTVTGTLDENSEVWEDGSYFNLHAFDGVAGQSIVIDLVSDDFDAYLLLLDPNRSLIDQDDDSGGGTNARIVLTLPDTGTYWILANSYGAREVGSYQLSLRPGDAANVEQSEPLADANRLNQDGIQLYEAGRYEEAEPLYLRSLAIREQQLGENHPLVAQSLNNLALLYQAQGRYGEAEPLLQRLPSILEQQLGENHPDVALSVNNLANLYHNQGRYGEAEPLYLRALSILEQELGENHPLVASSLNNLASLYQAQGRYGEAEPLYLRALSILEQDLGENHPRFAQSLSNLALLYQDQGRYGDAELLFRRSMAIQEQQFGKNHPHVATGFNNLAVHYQAQGRYGEAEPLIRRSLAIYEQQLGENHPAVAQSLNNLAVLYRTQRRYEEAEPLYLRSLSIWEQQLGENHPDVAQSLNNLASLYQDQGRYEEAEPLYLRSLSIREQQLGENHPHVATSLNNLAGLYQAQGNTAQALSWFQRGLDVEETNLSLNLVTGSDERKRAYIATLSGTTNAALSFHLQSTNSHPEATHLALTTVLRRKGRVLDAVTDSLQRLRQNLRPEDVPLLEEYTTAQSQLAALLYRGLAEQDPADYRTQVTALRQEVEQLENDLSRRSAEFRIETDPVEIAAVQTLIPADAALVELVQYRPFNPAASWSERWGNPRYAAYVLHASGTPQWVDLGEAETIDNAAFAFLQAVNRSNSGNLARTTARTLDKLVMEPIRPLLGNATHLLLSPDSQLNLVPFAALVDQQDRYLVESYTLTHLTTGRDLLRLQNSAPSRQPPVILANPDYNTADDVGVTLVTRATVASATRGDAQRSGDIANLRFGPLPGTELEVNAIAPLLSNPIVLTEAEATENAIKQVQAPSILHIATHGFFLEDVEFVPNPSTRGDRASIDIVTSHIEGPPAQHDRPISNENPLLRSGLALAGFNSRDGGENSDGVLTALEVTGLDLRGTRLVVLSACETGVGQVANGEGVYGLRRAFVMAGAESQLMSLWKVDDQGTADLMERYYQHLIQGGGRSEALRQVQLAFLEDLTYAHPYYWAAFLFSGDWQPIEALSAQL
jgi:CHAT domain-containing protein/Flp pilus assembly protein TadD